MRRSTPPAVAIGDGVMMRRKYPDSSCISSGLAALVLLLGPCTTTAFRFLDPSTAPMPAPPAASLLAMRQDWVARFSPAGPMATTLVSIPRRAASASRTWMAPWPQRSEASASWAPPSRISRKDGLSALPCSRTTSKPADFRRTAQSPPMLQ